VPQSRGVRRSLCPRNKGRSPWSTRP
jgi:hypothetical protein